MNITFIGGGNMATSLIGGLIADGYAPQSITVADINQAQLDNLQQRFQIRTFTDTAQAVNAADTVVIAVKPQAVKSVTQQLATALGQHKVLVISVAAGIRTADIGRWLGPDSAIVRAMPNTPALVQCGASALFATADVSEEQREQAESILRATGIALWVDDEAMMDTVTALSGSGPAYFFRIMESLEQGAVKLGLPKQTARLLILQTAMGAAKMALENPGEIAALRESVTSPGGTTAQGLRVMDEQDIDALFEQVLRAAHARSVELANELGED